MREVSKYGKTVDLAVSSALEELNATVDQVEVTVIERPRGGFLGIGSRKALVSVTLKKTPFDSGIDFLRNLIEKMDISAHIQVSDKSGRICRCQFVGRDVSQLIGRHGQTLNALQYLANLVVNKNSDHRMTLILDAENYRETRKKALISLADRVGERVAKTGKAYRFEPMPSFERKIIHSELAGNSKVETFSFGEEPRRYVTVALSDN